MMCPKCGYNQKKKYGYTCSGCGYTFTLDPKAKPWLSDKAFHLLLERVSAGGTRYYTLPQLYSAYQGRQFRKWRQNRKAGFVLLGIFGIGVLVALLFRNYFFAIVLGVLSLIFYRSVSAKRSCSFEEFSDLVDRWQNDGKKLDQLITRPMLSEPPPDSNVEDLYDYGIERLVIVEKPSMVDLLVLNGWHAEQHALVVGEQGYPKYILPLAQRYLQEQPDLPVFLLSNQAGMEERIAQSGLFDLAGHPVEDLKLWERMGPQTEELRKFQGNRAQMPTEYLGYGLLTAGLVMAVTDGVSNDMFLHENMERFRQSYGSSYG